MVAKPVSSTALKSEENHATTRKRVSVKINTVRGERDGRIRLPFDVACRFFAVHDKLGFPKASQTVDWLLSQSASAIAHLSDFPVVPERKKHKTIIRKRVDKSTTFDTSNKTTPTRVCKKELRNSARARARERAMEKKGLRCTVKDKKNLKTSTWFECDDIEIMRNSFDASDKSSILVENQCEIDEEFMWSDTMLTLEEGSWEDCI